MRCLFLARAGPGVSLEEMFAPRNMGSCVDQEIGTDVKAVFSRRLKFMLWNSQDF